MYATFLNANAQQAAQGGSLVMTVLMLVGWLAIMYFLLIRPQKKQQKQMDELRNAIQAGDNIIYEAFLKLFMEMGSLSAC